MPEAPSFRAAGAGLLLGALLACGGGSTVPVSGGTGAPSGGRKPGTVSSGSGGGTSSTGGTSSGTSSGGASSTGGTGSGGSSSVGSTSGGVLTGCGAVWQGGTRSFGPPVAMSSDMSSSILAPIFLPQGLVRAVVFEPSVPDLMLSDPSGQTGPLRLDGPSFPASAGAVGVQQPFDASSALVVLGQGSAVTFVSGSAGVGGPFALSTAGLATLSATLPLEGGAAALLLGANASGALVWATVGPSGVSRTTVVPLALSGAQTFAPALWDDGQGGVWVVLEATYGSQKALFAAHGGGTPFALGAPIRLDVLAPGALQGFLAVLGPAGQLGVLVVEGSAASPTVAGHVLSTAGSIVGGAIVSLPAAPSLPLVPQPSPWSGACQGGCDPALRFDGAGDLLAAWTLAGEISTARLPAGASSWPSRQQIAGGPLASSLAVDAVGDASAVTGGPGSYALLAVPASGSISLTPLLAQGATSLAFAAATGAGAGAFWAGSTQPAEILGWSYGATGNPTEVSPSTLPGGETPVGLQLGAAPAASAGPTSFEATYPTSFGPSFTGLAAPGWAAIVGSLGGADDLLLSTYDPTTAVLGVPTSVALSGWQLYGGTLFGGLQVDSGGAALLTFAQPAASANLYLSFAAAGSSPSTACAPLPLVNGGGRLTFATDLAAGRGDLFAGRDAPATAAVAR